MLNLDILARGAAEESRRSFFRRAAAAGPVAALAAGAAMAPEARAAAKTSLPNLYPNWNAKNFFEIRSNENTHYPVLTELLGANATPPPALNAAALTIDANNPFLFASFAQIFENTSAGAYQLTGPALVTPLFITLASQIQSVEAYQSGYLNALVNLPLAPGNVPFATPFPFQVILNNVSPFLANPQQAAQQAAAISLTARTPENDIAILNFARTLEFVEMNFYNINVPVFFKV